MSREEEAAREEATREEATREEATREEALKQDGDIRIHYKGGIYRKIVNVSAFSAIQANEKATVFKLPFSSTFAIVHENLAKACSNREHYNVIVTDDIAEWEDVTVYEHLYPNEKKTFARPTRMFDGTLEDGRKRFDPAKRQ